MMTLTMRDSGLCRCQLSHWSMVVSAFGYFCWGKQGLPVCATQKTSWPHIFHIIFFVLEKGHELSRTWLLLLSNRSDSPWALLGADNPPIPTTPFSSPRLPSPSNSVSSTMFMSLSASSFLSHHILAIPTCTQPGFPCCLPQSLCRSSSPACPDRLAKFAKWKCLLPHFSVLPPKFDRAKSLKMLLLSCICSVTWRGSRQVSP